MEWEGNIFLIVYGLRTAHRVVLSFREVGGREGERVREGYGCIGDKNSEEPW